MQHLLQVDKEEIESALYEFEETHASGDSEDAKGAFKKSVESAKKVRVRTQGPHV